MITDMLQYGKRVGPQLAIPAIIVLVGIASFGLGRLSGLKAGDRGLIIYPAPVEEATIDYAP